MKSPVVGCCPNGDVNSFVANGCHVTYGTASYSCQGFQYNMVPTTHTVRPGYSHQSMQSPVTSQQQQLLPAYDLGCRSQTPPAATPQRHLPAVPVGAAAMFVDYNCPDAGSQYLHSRPMVDQACLHDQHPIQHRYVMSMSADRPSAACAAHGPVSPACQRVDIGAAKFNATCQSYPAVLDDDVGQTRSEGDFDTDGRRLPEGSASDSQSSHTSHRYVHQRQLSHDGQRLRDVVGVEQQRFEATSQHDDTSLVHDDDRPYVSQQKPVSTGRRSVTEDEDVVSQNSEQNRRSQLKADDTGSSASVDRKKNGLAASLTTQQVRQSRRSRGSGNSGPKGTPLYGLQPPDWWGDDINESQAPAGSQSARASSSRGSVTAVSRAQTPPERGPSDTKAVCVATVTPAAVSIEHVSTTSVCTTAEQKPSVVSSEPARPASVALPTAFTVSLNDNSSLQLDDQLGRFLPACLQLRNKTRRRRDVIDNSGYAAVALETDTSDEASELTSEIQHDAVNDDGSILAAPSTALSTTTCSRDKDQSAAAATDDDDDDDEPDDVSEAGTYTVDSTDKDDAKVVQRARSHIDDTFGVTNNQPSAVNRVGEWLQSSTKKRILPAAPSTDSSALTLAQVRPAETRQDHHSITDQQTLRGRLQVKVLETQGGTGHTHVALDSHYEPSTQSVAVPHRTTSVTADKHCANETRRGKKVVDAPVSGTELSSQTSSMVTATLSAASNSVGTTVRRRVSDAQRQNVWNTTENRPVAVKQTLSRHSSVGPTGGKVISPVTSSRHQAKPAGPPPASCRVQSTTVASRSRSASRSRTSSSDKSPLLTRRDSLTGRRVSPHSSHHDDDSDMLTRSAADSSNLGRLRTTTTSTRAHNGRRTGARSPASTTYNSALPTAASNATRRPSSAQLPQPRSADQVTRSRPVRVSEKVVPGSLLSCSDADKTTTSNDETSITDMSRMITSSMHAMISSNDEHLTSSSDVNGIALNQSSYDELMVDSICQMSRRIHNLTAGIYAIHRSVINDDDKDDNSYSNGHHSNEAEATTDSSCCYDDDDNANDVKLTETMRLLTETNRLLQRMA